MYHVLPKKLPPLACVHIVKCAEFECMGICRIITALAKQAASFGYEISVLFLGDGPLLEMVRAAGVQASVVPWTGDRSDAAGALRVWSWLRRRRIKIVHLHQGGLLSRAVCRMAGVDAVVAHLHSLMLEDEGAQTSSQSMRFRGADAVIACSQAVADRFPRCNAEVIYTGIECDPEPPPPSFPSEPLKLGVLARLDPHKNIEALVEATARVAQRGIEVVTEVAGDGDVETAISLRELVTQLGISERVRLLGWRTDVKSLLASWDMLAIPSIEEGLPLSALEAMAAARPIVAYDVGGLRELIVDGVTGRLVAPGDTDALASCIVEMAGDRQRLAQMGIEGWRRVRSEFSAYTMAKHITDLYNRLLGRESNPGASSIAN